MFSDYQRGAGQFVLYSCPRNGHVMSPISPPRCPLSPSLLSSSRAHFQSSDTSWKDSEAGSWGQWGRKFTRIYLVLLVPELVGRCIFVMPGIATSKTVLLFMWGMSRCDTGGIFPLAGAHWHVGTLLGYWERRVSATHKDRNIPLSEHCERCDDKYKAQETQERRVASVSVWRCRGIIL